MCTSIPDPLATAISPGSPPVCITCLHDDISDGLSEVLGVPQTIETCSQGFKSIAIVAQLCVCVCVCVCMSKVVCFVCVCESGVVCCVCVCV